MQGLKYIAFFFIIFCFFFRNGKMREKLIRNGSGPDCSIRTAACWSSLRLISLQLLLKAARPPPPPNHCFSRKKEIIVSERHARTTSCPWINQKTTLGSGRSHIWNVFCCALYFSDRCCALLCVWVYLWGQRPLEVAVLTPRRDIGLKACLFIDVFQFGHSGT